MRRLVDVSQPFHRIRRQVFSRRMGLRERRDPSLRFGASEKTYFGRFSNAGA
jgi:hypothetical protein